MTAQLSVIIPVFNEAKFILPIIERVQSNPVVKEIIVVDDCSTDGTRDVLAKFKSDGVRIYFQDFNQGKGAALRLGIQQATSPLTIIQDADLEYDPSEYQKVIEPILANKADVVYGSRFARSVDSSWHTKGNQFLTAVSNLFTGLKLTDMETCYKAFKTEIIKNIPLRSNRFGFEPEVTAKVAKLKCRVVEVPISYKARSYAEGKKIGWKDGVSAIYTILKFWIIDDTHR